MSVALYTGTSFSRDQHAQITIVTFKENNPCFAGVVLRGMVSPTAYYAFVALKNHSEGHTTVISKNVRGEVSVLGTESSTRWQPGDVLRAAAVGPNLTLYRNERVVLVASDSTMGSGQAGIIIGCESGDVANAESTTS